MLNLKKLNLSGDSTKLKVHCNVHGKKICKCQSRNCDCKRFFNAPEASWGYDAYHDCFVFGHSLYEFVSWTDSDSSELPLYLMMATACRHDSVMATFGMHRITNPKLKRFKVNYGCFDAAHDATDFYLLAQNQWKTQLFIPLNHTNKGHFKQLPMAHINAQGIPICQQGFEMSCAGYCQDRHRIKWRCPLKSNPNPNPKCLCSTSSYGRVVYTHPKENPRLFPLIPRTSKKWQDNYNHRTASERVFKRQKNDFKLTSFKTRSKERQLFYALLSAICVHLEAWYHQDNIEIKPKPKPKPKPIKPPDSS